MMSPVAPWRTALLDVLFPPHCVACAAPGREPFCPVCAEHIEPAPALNLMGIDRAAAVWAYGGPVARAIQRFKYDRTVALARPLGAALRSIVGQPRPDAVIAVPLSAERRRSRGFNQARELVRGWRGVGPVVPITRAHERPAQVGQSKPARRANLRGVFRVSKPIAPSVLLVDDVITTGATVEAIAETLRAAGAKRVNVVALAATPLGVER